MNVASTAEEFKQLIDLVKRLDNNATTRQELLDKLWALDAANKELRRELLDLLGIKA